MYMMLRLLSAFLTSLAVTAVTGLVLIPFLRRKKAGQSIREDGPVWHRKKQGTPTMGGLMFIAGITVTCFTVGYPEIKNGEYGHLFVLAFALIYAGIGFLDDYEKLLKKQNLGLTAIQKFLLQLVVAVVFVLLMRLTGNLTPNLYIPFVNIYVPILEPVYFVLAAFIIVATVNAVNITDGVDGLATGVSIPVAVCYAAIAFLWGFWNLGIFGAALAGGLVGFLLFNFHPARVFMGDTGALFLGGAICAMAFAMDIPLVLILLGIIYVVETLSDIIQVASYKLTRKRVFKMAPLHHHLEMSGWSEYKLFFVFTAISAVFAFIAYYSVSLRFAVGP
jgi:phospho-N-acetylmuramoyl-pentapeptide-transferase